MSTTTTDTRNTRDGPTSTPRLGAGLMTSLLADGVSLTLVLGDALYISNVQQIDHRPDRRTRLTVDLVHDIKPDRGGKNSRKGKGARGL